MHNSGLREKGRELLLTRLLQGSDLLLQDLSVKRYVLEDDEGRRWAREKGVNCR